MRTQGKITFWNDEKGYGFIQSNSGAEKVFVHINAFGPHAERPSIDEKVSFSLSTDKQGRPCAAKVLRAGEKLPGKTQRNNYSGNVLIALIFISIVGMSVLRTKTLTFIYICWYICPTMVSVTNEQINSAKQVFRSSGGILRTGDALEKGIHRRTLYAMRDAGVLDCLGRGLYRLADLPLLSEPDLVTVAHKIPRGVICLISALAFHKITTQIPHAVYVALKRGAERPRLDYPPTRVFWFSGEAFTSGVEQHRIDGSVVRVYSIEKTLADCFKYRNKIGIDIALEALKQYLEKKKPRLKVLNEYARVCRVEKIMRPYIEAQL